MKKKNKISLFLIIITAFIVIVLSASLSSCQFGSANAAKTTSSGIETAIVKRGSIIQSISTTGTVDSSEIKDLSAKVSGEVLQSIDVGKEAKKGDILLKIDNSDLQLTITQAQISVGNAENSLKEARINYQSALDANHVAIQLAKLQNQSVQNSVESAADSINNTENSGNASVENAQLAVKKAQDSYNYSIAQAQISLNQAADKINKNPTDENNYAYQSAYLSRDSAISSATNALNSAIAALNQADAQTRVSIEEAQTTYENALINQSTTYWNTLLSQEQAMQKIQSSVINLDTAQKQVELAKLNLEDASKNLNNNTISAPFDGIILSSSYKAGQYSSTGSSAISIASKDFIITSSVNETDMPKIAIGNKAAISFDAYPDQEFNGEIIYISAVPTVSNNITSYEIKVKLNNLDKIKLQYGLSTNLTVITATADNVLMIPIQAVYKENGKEYVDVLVTAPTNKESTATSTSIIRKSNNTSTNTANNFTKTTINAKDITANSIKKVEITTGISNYNFVEVKSGLKEGDIVITSNISNISNIKTNSGSNFNIMLR